MKNLWRNLAAGTMIADMVDAFDEAIKRANYLHVTNGSSEAAREVLELAQNIIGAIAVEMRVDGTSERTVHRDALASMQATLDATELLVTAHMR